jgi:hypothetical protein
MTTNQRMGLIQALAACPDGSCIAGLPPIPSNLKVMWDAGSPEVKVAILDSIGYLKSPSSSGTSNTINTIAGIASAAAGVAGMATPMGWVQVALSAIGPASQLIAQLVPKIQQAFSGKPVTVAEQAEVMLAIANLRAWAKALDDTDPAFGGPEWKIAP